MAAINHQALDRVPTDFWATTEVQESLLNYFAIREGEGGGGGGGEGGKSPWIGLNGGTLSRGVKGILKLFDRMGIDGMLNVMPPYIGPEKREAHGLVFNEWGFGYREKKHASGTYLEQEHYPLADAETVEDLARYPWPDPDWYDYNALPGLIDQCGGRAVTVGYAALFTYHNYLRGLETSLMDPLLDPEFTGELLRRLGNFFMEYHTRCFEAAAPYIDTTQVTDDWGSQNGLMTGPDIFHKYYQPFMQQAITLAKRYDIAVIHHDDGDCRRLIPDFVSMGIDVLNPIQYRCGNWDLARLKADYGKDICFHSGIDNQAVLPMGTPEDVKHEVIKLIRNLASDGTGFIVGPCHNLQPNTSLENILALYEAAAAY